MNITFATRLPKEVVEDLRNSAKEKDLNISTLIQEGMKAVIKGDLQLEKPKQKEKRINSSVSVEHDVVVAFKQKLKEKGLSIDKGVELLVHAITHTAH